MKRIALVIAGAAVFSMPILTACSGGTQSANPVLPVYRDSALNMAYGNGEKLAGTVQRYLFVGTDSSNVLIFSRKDGRYREVGQITNGISDAAGLWVDNKGSLYVANADSNVVEYKNYNWSSPACTYTGISNPINVTTDSKGDVFVVDYNSSSGLVDEFAQCSNSIMKQFTVGSGDFAEDAAVDKAGNLFVSYSGGGVGGFAEFKAGSSSPMVLGATVYSSGGIALDKNDNLIAADQLGSIDVIAPPYNSAQVLISGLATPTRISLNSAETLLFSANHGSYKGSPSVTVYSYPSGSLVKTISGKPFANPPGCVAVSPEAVF